jgi:hypothetical protein
MTPKEAAIRLVEAAARGEEWAVDELLVHLLKAAEAGDVEAQSILATHH